MIMIIDDDEIMAECIAGAIGGDVLIYNNAIDAMDSIAEGNKPKIIFLDILLDGPDGFTFLNELVSYDDTAKIPVVIVSSFDFTKKDLSVYGVVGVLNKDTIQPKDIKRYVEQYTR